MIDTSKYEGYTEGPWDTLVCSTTGKKWVIDGSEDSAWKSIALIDGVGENDVGWKNMTLMADAPLLLAEVIRLREDNKKLHDAIKGCAYRGSEGSALDLYCESIIERCPTCYQNIDDMECGCEEE